MNQDYLNKLEELRNKSAVKKKRVKLPPLLRGWTGASMGGQSLGPLDSGSPGFDTRVLELKVCFSWIFLFSATFRLLPTRGALSTSLFNPNRLCRQ